MLEIPTPFAAFFEKSAIPLTLADARNPELPLLLVNDAFSAMTGFGRDEILGRNCRFLQGPGTEDEARRDIRRALDDQRDAQIVITNYRKDGSEFLNLLFLYLVAVRGEAPAYFMGSPWSRSVALA